MDRNPRSSLLLPKIDFFTVILLSYAPSEVFYPAATHRGVESSRRAAGTSPILSITVSSVKAVSTRSLSGRHPSPAPKGRDSTPLLPLLAAREGAAGGERGHRRSLGSVFTERSHGDGL